MIWTSWKMGNLYQTQRVMTAMMSKISRKYVDKLVIFSIYIPYSGYFSGGKVFVDDRICSDSW